MPSTKIYTKFEDIASSGSGEEIKMAMYFRHYFFWKRV